MICNIESNEKDIFYNNGNNMLIMHAVYVYYDSMFVYNLIIDDILYDLLHHVSKQNYNTITNDPIFHFEKKIEEWLKLAFSQLNKYPVIRGGISMDVQFYVPKMMKKGIGGLVAFFKWTCNNNLQA